MTGMQLRLVFNLTHPTGLGSPEKKGKAKKSNIKQCKIL